MRSILSVTLLLLFTNRAFPCTKIACIPVTTIKVICHSKCPSQVKALIDDEIIFDSCNKDAWKNLHGLSNFFSFQDSKKNKFFTLRKPANESVNSFVLLAGSNCKSLKENIRHQNLQLSKSEYYPNGPKCDKAPCVSYSGTVELE